MEENVPNVIPRKSSPPQEKRINLANELNELQVG